MKDGYYTSIPENYTYARVILHKNVRITLIYAVLNGLDIYRANNQNTYL